MLQPYNRRSGMRGRGKRRKTMFGIPDTYRPSIFEEDMESPYITELNPTLEPAPSRADDEIDMEDRFLPGWELRQKLLKSTNGGWIKPTQQIQGQGQGQEKKKKKEKDKIPKSFPHVRALKQMITCVVRDLRVPVHETGPILQIFQEVPHADASLNMFVSFASALVHAMLASFSLEMDNADVKDMSKLLAKAMQFQSQQFTEHQRKVKLKKQAAIDPFLSSFVRAMSLVIKHNS